VLFDGPYASVRLILLSRGGGGARGQRQDAQRSPKGPLADGRRDGGRFWMLGEDGHGRTRRARVISLSLEISLRNGWIGKFDGTLDISRARFHPDRGLGREFAILGSFDLQTGPAMPVGLKLAERGGSPTRPTVVQCTHGRLSLPVSLTTPFAKADLRRAPVSRHRPERTR